MVRRTRWRLWAIAVLVGLGVLATRALPAHAQVAAPSLVPFTFYTDNPAVMQWGGPSRIGVQGFQATAVTDPATVTDTLDGISGGVRGVWQHFSFALEGGHAESSNKPFGFRETADYGAD